LLRYEFLPPEWFVVPELGKLDGKKIAALVGVAPMNHDSGREAIARRKVVEQVCIVCYTWQR